MQKIIMHPYMFHPVSGAGQEGVLNHKCLHMIDTRSMKSYGKAISIYTSVHLNIYNYVIYCTFFYKFSYDFTLYRGFCLFIERILTTPSFFVKGIMTTLSFLLRDFYHSFEVNTKFY